MSTPTTESLSKLAGEAERLLQRLSSNVGVIVATATAPVVDGYPTRSLRTDGVSTGGEPSDPTGNTATSDLRTNPLSSTLARLYAELEAAVLALYAADSCRYAILEPRRPADDDRTNDCVNCGVKVDGRRKAGRCPACYQYRRRSGGVLERPLDIAVETDVRRRSGETTSR